MFLKNLLYLLMYIYFKTESLYFYCLVRFFIFTNDIETDLFKIKIFMKNVF